MRYRKVIAGLILFFGTIGVVKAQAPVISSVSPSSGIAGSVVTINGTHFAQPADIVYFGATKAQIVSESSNQIKVTVPAGTNYQPVTVNTNSLTAYSSIPFNLTFSAAEQIDAQAFGFRADFTSGLGVYGTASEDFDGDGRNDVIVLNFTSGTFTILRRSTVNNQSFNYGLAYDAEVNYSTPSPLGIAVGDFDGDGKPDIVITNYNLNQISVYLNTSTTGNISFRLASQIKTGTSPYGVAVADFDGDGRPDIVVSNQYDNPGTITIYHNLTTTPGLVDFSQTLNLQVGNQPRSLTTADIDGDGKPDIIVANQESSNISIFLNKSTSNNLSFNAEFNLATPAGSSPESVATADFNNDGKLDIVVANNNSPGSVSVFGNISVPGTLKFQSRQDFSTGNNPFSVATDDLNGDGKIDIAVTNQVDNTFSVLANAGVGSAIAFSKNIDYVTRSNPRSISIADQNGDGKPDLIVGNNNDNEASIFLNTMTLAPPPPQITSFSPTATASSSTVAIIGTNFTGTTAVSFGGVPAASFIVVSDTEITAVLGSGASGNVSVTTPSGTATAAGFSFIVPPDISYQTPQVYTVGTTISPLAPTNTRGAVPADVYGLDTDFAGTGQQGDLDGLPNVAQFFSPYGLAIDANGNFFVGEQNNETIREISPSGVVSTYAGIRGGGYADGPAATARFEAPDGVATDKFGNVFVADGNAIRKIDASGIVTTLAGGGAPGFADGQGASASFNAAINLVADNNGNLYVCDFGNRAIRKVTANGTVTTLAGNGTSGEANGMGTAAQFYGPNGITMDNSGNICVADASSLRKITPAGLVTTLAGNFNEAEVDGPALSASFASAYGLVIDKSGNIYVVDVGANTIRKIDTKGIVSTIITHDINGNLTDAYYPFGVTLDGKGNLYYTSVNDNWVRKISLLGYTIDKPLPAGLAFDSTTGIISGTPTAASPATDYTVTAYNTAGSSSTIINITVIDPSKLVFDALPPKTVCDIDFDPAATGTGTITYTSSNTSVATIVSGLIHITGAGTSVITASNGQLQVNETLTVTPALVPSITISPDLADNCADMPVTFTATATNGGTSAVYQWQVNGQNSGTNNAVFTSNNLNNNDKITCILTSSEACVSNATVTSNTALFTQDPSVTASVIIISSETGAFCAGTAVTFTAVSMLPDNGAVYQWQLNGNNVGTNSATYTNSSLTDGDVVNCILISSVKCVVNAQVVSNSIITKLNPSDICNITIPNAITPNGDGINDEWNITALQGYPQCTVNIFSRYGSVVYSSIGYSKAFNGTLNGSALPMGVYYYIIDLKNGKKPLSGWVTILR